VFFHFPYGSDVQARDNLVSNGHVYSVRRIFDDQTHQYDVTALTTRLS
jgi:hypothetical protein